MNDPTERRSPDGRVRRTGKPPMSRGRPSMTTSMVGVSPGVHVGSAVGSSIMVVLCGSVDGSGKLRTWLLFSRRAMGSKHGRGAYVVGRSRRKARRKPKEDR